MKKKLESPLPHYAKFGWNWFSSFGEEEENVKRLKQWQLMDKFWSDILIWAFGSGELKICVCVFFKNWNLAPICLRLPCTVIHGYSLHAN